MSAALSDDDEESSRFLLGPESSELLFRFDFYSLFWSTSIFEIELFLLPEDRLDPPELEEDDEDEEELESFSAAYACASNSAYFYSSRSLGASLTKARRSSVISPKPIDVKKFIENLALATLSLGKTPPRKGLTSSSLSFFANAETPRFSEISCISILMKILEAEVVCSSVRIMFCMQLHSMLSVSSKCPKNLAAFLSLFTSNL